MFVVISLTVFVPACPSLLAVLFGRAHPSSAMASFRVMGVQDAAVGKEGSGREGDSQESGVESPLILMGGFACGFIPPLRDSLVEMKRHVEAEFRAHLVRLTRERER